MYFTNLVNIEFWLAESAGADCATRVAGLLKDRLRSDEFINQGPQASGAVNPEGVLVNESLENE